MVIRATVGSETIFMDGVIFIREEMGSVTVTTEDEVDTEIASADGPVELLIFTDNGVQIEPTIQTEEGKKDDNQTNQTNRDN